jgi:CRISPR/Cas system CSM-associated protein Csm4 (group 5 of RAMP superfamily)
MEKRLALNYHKRNKDKKKIKIIINDLYEEYEDKTPQQTQPIDKTPQTQTQPVDDNFENKLKGIFEEPDTEEKNDIQQSNFSPSFKLISRRRK